LYQSKSTNIKYQPVKCKSIKGNRRTKLNKKNGFKKTPCITKWYYLIFILGILVVLIGISTLQAGGKKGKIPKIENQRTQVNEHKAELEQGEKLSAWKIIKMTDWLFWPFVLITAAGIMLITYRTLFEHRERSRSQILMQSQVKANSIRKIIQMTQSSNPTRVSKLMYQIVKTFYKTNRAEPIGDDINQFLATERESFETFNRINGFLSESAGALGLLGTVWGIFQTFHAGKLDGPTILQGMSISLVTTLVGLIISLILNMGGTYVFTLFNRQLNLLANKAEELRQVLLYLEKGSSNMPQTMSKNFGDLKVAEFKYRPEKQSSNRKSSEFALADI